MDVKYAYCIDNMIKIREFVAWPMQMFVNILLELKTTQQLL